MFYHSKVDLPFRHLSRVTVSSAFVTAVVGGGDKVTVGNRWANKLFTTLPKTENAGLAGASI